MYKQLLQVISREASFPIHDYGDGHFVLTQQMVGELRVLSYMEQWRKASTSRWYHVKMQDHSLFLFSEGLKPSYSFLHCPVDVMPFTEYLSSLGVENTPQMRREHFLHYQEVFDTASAREHISPIRFDYDPDGYMAGVHPVAHIHIGLQNQIRISSNKMSATSFFLFVMRHMYPDSWRRLLERKDRKHLVRSIRDTNTCLDAKFWTELDQVELHLK